MLIIAERINASRKYIAQAISSRNAAFIQDEAKAQDHAGADFIDVNAGTFVGEEADKLRWVVEAVQQVTAKPLCIDSPDPAVIEAILPVVKKTPMINSITLERSRIEGIIPLVAEHKTKVIALCQSEAAMAETTDEKLRLAAKLAEKVTAAGIALDDLYIDPLVYPLAANSQAVTATLRAVKKNHGGIPRCPHDLRTDKRLPWTSLPQADQSRISGRGHYLRPRFGHHGPHRHSAVCRHEGGHCGKRQGRVLHGFCHRIPGRPTGFVRE
jgi:cobalamin-dependent methionine synthase I